uniref:Uncharacterized protein n=1 Tax=Hyaloperonospora arabidopsidis (strain Emoy2) TaxID=559515 RepID=M4B8Y5_HYAAE
MYWLTISSGLVALRPCPNKELNIGRNARWCEVGRPHSMDRNISGESGHILRDLTLTDLATMSDSLEPLPVSVHSEELLSRGIMANFPQFKSFAAFVTDIKNDSFVLRSRVCHPFIGISEVTLWQGHYCGART